MRQKMDCRPAITVSPKQPPSLRGPPVSGNAAVGNFSPINSVRLGGSKATLMWTDISPAPLEPGCQRRCGSIQASAWPIFLFQERTAGGGMATRRSPLVDCRPAPAGATNGATSPTDSSRSQPISISRKPLET